MKAVNFIDHKQEMIQIFAKAWTDELFKQRLLKNPDEVFKEFGIPMNKKTKISLHFDSQDQLHVNFPLKPKDDEISEEQLKMIVGGLSLDPSSVGIGMAAGAVATVAAVAL